MKNPQARMLDRWARHCCARGTLLFCLLVIGAAQAQDFTYTNIDGTITITRYTGPGGNVTIPSTIDGLPVRVIGAQSFWWSTNLTRVTIPEGVTNIGVDVFGGCTSLTNVIMPNSLVSIDDLAFWSCTLLSQAAIPNGVSRIGVSAFGSCSSL